MPYRCLLHSLNILISYAVQYLLGVSIASPRKSSCFSIFSASVIIFIRYQNCHHMTNQIRSDKPPWLLRALKAYTSSELYPGYFRLLYFCQAFPSHFYRERYSFERAFFTHRCFLPCTPSPHCRTFGDSDAGRNTPSRTLLCACPTPPADAWFWTTHIVDTRPLFFLIAPVSYKVQSKN